MRFLLLGGGNAHRYIVFCISFCILYFVFCILFLEVWAIWDAHRAQAISWHVPRVYTFFVFFCFDIAVSMIMKKENILIRFWKQ